MADNVSNLSGGYLSKPKNVYEEQPALPVNLKKPTQIYNEEPLPEVVIEAVPEVIVEPVVVEEKVEKPKINFNYNKPEGWDRSNNEKKLNIFQIAWFGIRGKEMNASEQRKFDNVIVADGLPILIITLICVIVFCIVSFSSSFNTKYVEGGEKNNDIINRCIDYFVDKYKHKQAQEQNNPTVYIDTVKVEDVKTYRDSILVEPKEEVQPTPQPVIDTVVKVEEVVVKPQEPKKGFDKESLYRYYDSIKKARKN